MSSARMAPTPRRPRNDSHDNPRCWYGRSVPSKPIGVSIGSRRWSACPDSRSPSHPSASTADSGSSPRSPSAPIAAPNTSAAVIVPDCLPSRNFSAALRCRSSSSTHWPRTRTSGTLSLASSASSSGESTSSPTARSYRKDTRSSMPNWLCLAEADEPPTMTGRSASGQAAPCAPSPGAARRTPPRTATARCRAGTRVRPPCRARLGRAPPRAAPRQAPGTAGPPRRAPQAVPPPDARRSAAWSRPASQTRSLSTRPPRAPSGSGPRPTAARTQPASPRRHLRPLFIFRISRYARARSVRGPSAVSDGSTSRKQVRTEPTGSAALASQSANVD